MVDWNMIYQTYIAPALDWLVKSGIGGIITYWVVRQLANKKFKSPDLASLTSDLASKLTGSTLDIDLTAVAQEQLNKIQTTLTSSFMSQFSEQANAIKQLTQVVANISDVYANSNLVSDEQKTRIAQSIAQVRSDVPAKAKERVKIKLEPIKAAVDDAVQTIIDKGKDYIKAG